MPEVVLTKPYRVGRWSRVCRFLGKKWTSFEVRRGCLVTRGIGRAGWGVVLHSFTTGGGWTKLTPVTDVGGLSEMLKRRPVRGPSTGAVAEASIELSKLTKLKPIVHHLALLQYHDGTPRRPGRITLEVRGQMYTALLTDPDAVASLRVSAPTFEDLLATVCLLLEQEEAPWEHAKWLEEPAKKGRKK